MADDSIILHPQTGDTVLAEDVLAELSLVLRKRGYALIHRQDAMVLVKITDDAKMHGRAVGYVRQIAPRFYEYKALEWTHEFLRRPNA